MFLDPFENVGRLASDLFQPLWAMQARSAARSPEFGDDEQLPAAVLGRVGAQDENVEIKAVCWRAVAVPLAAALKAPGFPLSAVEATGGSVDQEFQFVDDQRARQPEHSVRAPDLRFEHGRDSTSRRVVVAMARFSIGGHRVPINEIRPVRTASVDNE